MPSALLLLLVLALALAPATSKSARLFPTLTWRTVASDVKNVRIWLTSSIPVKHLVHRYAFSATFRDGSGATEAAAAGWILNVSNVKLGADGQFGTGVALDAINNGVSTRTLVGKTVTVDIQTTFRGKTHFQDSVDLVFVNATKASLARAALYRDVGEKCAVGCKEKRCQAISISDATKTIPLIGGGGDNEPVSNQYGFDDIISSITDVGLGRLMIVPQGFLDHGFERETTWKELPLIKYTSIEVVNASKGGYRLLRKGHECMSKDESMGQSCSLQECANKCSRKSNCGYFIYGTGTKKGKCFHEKTPNETCPEGFEEDQYDFYAIDPNFHAPETGFQCNARMIRNALSLLTDRSPFQRMQDIYDYGGDAVWVQSNLEKGVHGYKCSDTETDKFNCFDFDANVNPAFGIRLMRLDGKDINNRGFVGTAMSQDPSRYPLLFLSNGVKIDDVSGLLRYLESGGTILYENTLDKPIGRNRFMMDAVESNRFVQPFLDGTPLFFQKVGLGLELKGHYQQYDPNFDCFWKGCYKSGPCELCSKGGFAGKCCNKAKNESGCDIDEGGDNKYICVAGDSGWNNVTDKVPAAANPQMSCPLELPPSMAWANLVAHYTSKPRPPIAKSQNIHVFQGDWVQTKVPTFSGQLQCSDPNPGDSMRCTYELSQNPTHGNVYLAPNGTWTYTGKVDVPSTCNSNYLLNDESTPKFCSFPQKYSGHGLRGDALGTYSTFTDAKAACLGQNTCGGIVQRQQGETIDCWGMCGQKSGPCSACDRGGFAGKCCRKNWKGGENGCLPSEGGAGHICVAQDPRWNTANPWVYELRSRGEPQEPLSGQHACWPRVCIPDTAASQLRSSEDCENRWSGRDAFTFVAKDSYGTPSMVEGVVYLAQGYNPSYATGYKHHEIPYVKYEAECNLRDDESSALDAVVSDIFFGDGMLFRPDHMYQHMAAGRPALLKVHVTSETRGSSPNVKAVFEVGNVTKGTVCLNGPNILPTREDMNSTFQFKFPNGTGKDFKGNPMPSGRCGMKDVSQYGVELPEPPASTWPGWTGQDPCTMDVDAFHKENHAIAFTAMINPDWIQPGLRITIRAGAAAEVQHDIRVNPKTNIDFLNIDQVMFGFRSAYTLQHRDLIKQWLSIYMSASSVTETNAMVSVDFGQSKDGPLTRSTRTTNLKWGGFSGLIQNSINLAGNAKLGFGFTPNIIGSVNHFPAQGGGYGGGNNAGQDATFQVWTHEVAHAMGRGHVCGDEPAGVAYPRPHGKLHGINGGNGPSWTLDLSRGPPKHGVSSDDPSLRAYISWANPLKGEGKWSETMRSSVMCSGVSNADPDYFLDGESDFLRFKNGLWANQRIRWNKNAYGDNKPGWEEYISSNLLQCLRVGGEGACGDARPCWHYGNADFLEIIGLKDCRANVSCSGSDYMPGMTCSCVTQCEAIHGSDSCMECVIGRESSTLQPNERCGKGPNCTQGMWVPKFPEKKWSPPGTVMPGDIDNRYDLATAPGSVPTFNVWFSFDKRITNGVGTGWDGPLLGNSLARWTFIGSPIWFERGQVLKFYDPVHYIGAAKKVRNDPGRRFVVSWIQEAENGLTVTHQVLNKDDTKSSWTSDRWAGGAASVVAIDGGVGALSSVSLYLLDSPEGWSRRSFQDRYLNPGACFDPSFLGTNADLGTIVEDLSLKTRILHDRNVPHGLPNRNSSLTGKRMFSWSHAQLPPTVSYTTSRPEVVTNTGKIHQPAFGLGPALTEITARISTAGAVDIRRAIINVLQAAPGHGGVDSILRAALDRAHRVILGCQPSDGVVQHLPSPATYSDKPQPALFGATVALLSSSEEKIVNITSGRITRPQFNETDIKINLEISATFGGATKTKQLGITVKKHPCDGCQDNSSWVDPVHGNASCSAWSSIDCNVARQGYSHPDVVKKACPLTCAICGGVRSSNPLSRPTWQCGDVPGPYIELEGLSLPLSVSSNQDRRAVFTVPYICSNGGDQARWQVTKDPGNAEVTPQLFPTFEARAIPGLRIVTDDGWRGNKTVSAKAVDRWGQSAEITWLIDPPPTSSNYPSPASNPSHPSNQSPSPGESTSDSNSSSAYSNTPSSSDSAVETGAVVSMSPPMHQWITVSQFAGFAFVAFILV